MTIIIHQNLQLNWYKNSVVEANWQSWIEIRVVLLKFLAPVQVSMHTLHWINLSAFPCSSSPAAVIVVPRLNNSM